MLATENEDVRSLRELLIIGHDLKDMEELLKQTDGTGIDVYTHGEMLPANYYPAFKKYDHFVGNYGGSWWQQNTEFESFNGPILLTTNCLVPLKKTNTYLALLFLGVKGIRLGPTLPAFLSPAVAKVLVEKFDIKPIGTVDEDIAAMMAGH